MGCISCSTDLSVLEINPPNEGLKQGSSALHIIARGCFRDKSTKRRIETLGDCGLLGVKFCFRDKSTKRRIETSGVKPASSKTRVF